MTDYTQARESDLQQFFTSGEDYHQKLVNMFAEIEQLSATAAGVVGFLPPGRWIDPLRATIGYSKYNNDFVEGVHTALLSHNVGLPDIATQGGILVAPNEVVAAVLESRGLVLQGDVSLRDLLLTVLDEEQLKDYQLLVANGVPPLQAEMLVSRTDSEAINFRKGVRLAMINQELADWAGSGNEPEFDRLVQERDDLIADFTGSDEHWSYDPDVTVIAMQNGLTYEQADFAVTTNTIDQLSLEIDGWTGHPNDGRLADLQAERADAIEHLAEGDPDLTLAIHRRLNTGVPAGDVLIDAVGDVYGDQNMSEILEVLNARIPGDGSEPVFDPIALALQSTLVNEVEEFTGVGFEEADLGIAIVAQDEGETYNSIVAMIKMDQESGDPQFEWPGDLPTYLDVPIQSGREAAFIMIADETGVFRELETADDGGMDNYDGLMGASAWQAVLDAPEGEFSSQAVDLAEFFRDNPTEWAMFDTAREQGAALSTLAEGEYYIGDGDNKTSFADVQQYVTNTDVFNTLMTAVEGDNALLIDLDGDGVYDEDEFEAAIGNIETMMAEGGADSAYYEGLTETMRFAMDSDMLDQPDNRAWYEKVGSGMYRIGSLVPMSPTFLYRAFTEPGALAGDYWSFTVGAGKAVGGLGLMLYDLSAMNPTGPAFYLESWRVGGDVDQHRGVQMARALPEMGNAVASLVPGTPQYDEAMEAVRRSGTWDSHPGTNLLLTVVDVEGFVENPAEWAGQFAPDLIITAFTGGGGAISRIGSTGSRLSGATRRLLLNVSNNGLRMTTRNALRRAGTRLTTLPLRLRYNLTLRGLLPNDGRIYFMGPDDGFVRNLGNGTDLNPNGMLDVVGHGSPTSMQIDFPGGSRIVTPTEMAALIRSQPQFNGQPIRLLSCETGCDATGFARQLADELGVPVYAPDQLAWAYPDGSVRVASETLDEDLARVVPTFPPDGDFNWFTPDGVDPPNLGRLDDPGTGDGLPPAGADGVSAGPAPRTPDEVAEIVDSRGWQTFDPSLNDEFFPILDEFGGNPITNRSLRGGEGQLFLSPDSPNLALKRWHQSRLEDLPGSPGFETSLQKMDDAWAAVHGDTDLAQVMDVTQIHSRGDDWIIRDFDPDSKPLHEALTDGEPGAQEALDRALLELRNSNDPSLRDIYAKIARPKPSVNVHWSPSQGKLLVIDMQ